MRGQNVLFLVLFLALGTGAQTWAQDSQGWPLLVHSGYWKATHDADIKTTGGVFFGGPGSMGVKVTNEDCGRRIVIEAEGRRIVLHHQAGSSYAAEPESVSGERMMLTMRWHVDVVDRSKFDMVLKMSAAGAKIPLAGARRIRFTTTPSEPERRPECECDELDEYLAERIAEAESLAQVYGNPEYWVSPTGLPPRVKWDAYLYELVLNGVLAGKTHAQAASEAVAHTASRDYGSTDNAADLSSEAPSGAKTNTTTCEVTLGHPDPSIRFPAIWTEEMAYHEGLHAKRCQDIKATADAAKARLLEPPGKAYSVLMNNPQEAGLEEVRAYQATIAWLKTWKRRNCGE